MRVSAAVCLLFLACGPKTGTERPRNSGAASLDTPPVRSLLVAPAAEQLRHLFAECRLTRESSDPFPHLTVHAEDGKLLGFQVCSDHAGTTAEGYGGPVPVQVFLDASARVLGFDLLPNDETPGYLSLCEDSLKLRLKGYFSGQAKKVDAVTLATISSTAIIKSVTATADRVAREIVKTKGD